MVSLAPCQPTIGKVDLVLDDVFNFSRLIGMFPIDFRVSVIHRCNLAKGIILYLPTSAISILVLHRSISSEDVLLETKVSFTIITLTPILLILIHFACLIRNKCLLKELYDELKGIEYQFWKSGVGWFHRTNWFTKYFSIPIMLVSCLVWDTIDGNQLPEATAYYFIYTAFLTIMIQYAILIQVFLSILRSIRTIEESRIVIQLADKLLALCRNVNTLYAPQLFLCISLTYFLILFTVLYVIRTMGTGGPYTLIFLVSLMSPVVQIVIQIGFFSQE
ncbi:Gustatory receptor 119c, partial [Halyomorpha halys]